MATEISINPEPIQSFFSKLEARKALLSTITDIHKTLTSHFSTVDLALSRKSEDLDARISSLQQNTQNALNELQNREDGIPTRELSIAARVEELKAAAVAEIETEELKEESLSETLRSYCRKMDGGGLMNFLFENRKDSAALRTEIPDAVQESVDAMRLVLDAAEDYVGMKREETHGMADRRRACGMLIQSVVPPKESGVVGRTLKERAVGVLEKWKAILGDGNKGGGIRPNEASMFLQLVVGFGLKKEFKEDFLRKLVVQFASRRDMPKLAVALGFEKIADIIDQLVKSGKEIEAIYFASEAGLTEQYPPVSLLKSSLRNCKRNAKDSSKKGNFSASAVEKANNLELEATKAIIQCVEDLKLEDKFPLEGLKKRVEQLENAKSGKRKSTAFPNKPSKKQRALGGSRGGDGGRGKTPSSSSRPPKAGRFSGSLASVYPRNPPRPPPARYSGPYNYPNYEGHASASYGPPPLYSETHAHYGAAAQQPQGTYGGSPVGLSQQYGSVAAHYVPQAPVGPGTYGGSPVAPSQQYGYSPQDASRVRGTIPHEGTVTHEAQGAYTVPSDYAAYDYGAAAAAYPSSYQTQ